MQIKFEKRDIWIGVYWDRFRNTNYDFDKKIEYIFYGITFYVCIVPLFPIIFKVITKKTQIDWNKLEIK